MMTGTQGHPRQGDPASTAPEDQAIRDQDIQRELRLRQQAVQRMRYMSVQHAMHAWEHRYADPIAPYALAFLYAQPSPQQGWLALHAATKLWLAGPEAADLPRLLFSLNESAAQRLADPRFDLRRDFANRVDEKMADDAWYIGLGVSSLDTYSGTWGEACAKVNRCGDLPGQVRIVMTDSTVIVCDRRGLSEFNSLTVHSTHALSLQDGPYPWSAVGAQDLRADPAHTSVLRWMEELNLSLWRSDNARLVARQPRRVQP